MSAFMMSEKSLAKIAAYVHRHADRHRNYTKTFVEHCRKYAVRRDGKVVEWQTYTPENLYRVLEAMNAESLKQRYGDGLENNIAEADPVIPLYGAFNKFEILKAIRCFLYQCAEGDVPETELYKAVEALSNDLAYDIINEMPEYENAVWG